MFKNRVTLVMVAMLVFGCSTESEPATVYEVAIDFSLITGDGEDLLDPEHPNAITEENTDLYYLIDDNLVNQFHENLDSPKMFFVSDEKKPFNEHYFLRVFSNIQEGQDTALTYLKFDDGSMDTIKTQYKVAYNSTIVTKVWYNGDLKCDVYDKENPDLESNQYGTCYFTITHNVE